MFEDQLEQLKEYFENLSSRVQESSLYNSVYERFVSFSPQFQKVIIACCVFLVLFLVISRPIANYKSSVENLYDYEERKDLTQKIVNFGKNSSTRAPQPKEYNLQEFQSGVVTLAQSYSIKLLPEQVGVLNGAPKKTVPGVKQNNFVVKITKANVEQIAALTYSIQRSNKSLFLSGIDFIANPEDPRYFDSSLYVTNLYVDPITNILPKPETEETPPKGRGRFR